MTESEALICLNLVGGIGSTRLRRLLDYFGKPQQVFVSSEDKLVRVCGIGRQLCRNILSFKRQALDEELSLVKKYGLQIITLADSNYPHNLKNIADPPIVLYLKGEIKAEDSLALGIVGSRRASFYGLSCAGRFAYALGERGFTVVSGMARGVDTASHRGALKAQARTIAVMGSGFAHLYPAENKELAEEIARSGAVLTEFPVNTLPLKQNFPCRNRLISGLSLGVLVVEASENSGALITADCALEQGREVFALPGKLDSLTSLGTNRLIKQGAKLVCGIEDILDEFKFCLEPLPKPGVATRADLDEKERCVYALTAGGAVHIDEIAEKTGMDISEISAILLRLQLKRLISEASGGLFTPLHRKP